MQLSIDVVRAGTTVTVTTRPADIVAWEAHSGRSVAGWGDTPPSYTDICYLAFSAEQRGSSTVTDFDSWVQDVDAVTLGGMEAGNPTQ